MTLSDLETALDMGHLWAKTAKDRWWLCRRNGKTKLWKRTPDRFELPFKAGFRSCGRIDNKLLSLPFFGQYFIISESNPNDR